MARVKILVEGYASKQSNRASSSVVLLEDNGIYVIVDPGVDRDKLLNALKKQRLTPCDINYVVLTHYHLDHSLLTGIFIKAKVLDNNDLYSWDGKEEEHQGRVPKTKIRIIKTPGHDPFHCAVLADTQKGRVVVAGDVFWWWNEEKQKTDRKSLSEHQDPYVKDAKALRQSRRKILQLADYIIPGHGKMFKTTDI